MGFYFPPTFLAINYFNAKLNYIIMAKSKKNKKPTTIDIVKANRTGEFNANKDILNVTKSAVYRSKKNYTRKAKHKKIMA